MTKLWKKLLVIIALFAISCNPFENISEVKKREEALKNPRFKELPEEEMYAFLNEVYLKKFDSLQVTPVIYVYPITYQPKVRDSVNKSKAEIDLSMIPPPPGVSYDSSYTWKGNKLFKVNITNDIQKHSYNGIMFLSKPFRDTLDNTIILKEYITFTECCTCVPEEVFFLKTKSGWKQIPKY